MGAGGGGRWEHYLVHWLMRWLTGLCVCVERGISSPLASPTLDSPKSVSLM